MVADALVQAQPGLEVTLEAMTTAGDRELHKTLTSWGYKGLFTKELEDALLEGRVDLAVHSMKDMPSLLPDGLMIAGMLEREDIRDAWISPRYETLETVPQGALIGTSSARRKAQLLYHRPDVKVVEFRGNVETRLKKLEEGLAEATFLAAAGLKRLELTPHIRSYLSPDVFLPAVSQGAIGIECASAREDVRALIARISHAPTMVCLAAERAFLQELDGSCRTPIAGLAELDGERITMRGEVLSRDGTIRHYDAMEGAAADAATMGAALGQRMRATAGDALLSHG